MKNAANALLNRVEFPVLLAGLVIAAGLWGFEELMEIARATTPHAFDTEILLAFRQA
ncbi:MAG: phosphoesterase, partial [Mesorhizobium sp.]